jgi:FemAB family protein
MPIVSLEKIKGILNKSGLNAEFRLDSENTWSSITKNGKNVPYLYMEHFVDYQAVHSNNLSSSLVDISLILFHDNLPCGVWPLMFDIDAKESLKSINNQYGGIVVPPLFINNFPKKSERKIIKACIDFLNNLLSISAGDSWRTYDVFLSGYVSQWHQIALENGAALNRVCYEMHLDISMPIDVIRKSIRKSYKPLVSAGLRKWTVSVMDQHCEDTWSKFRRLHKTVAGFITRPIDTWNIQHQAIASGNAFLVYVLNSDGIMIGGGYFDMSCHQCYYSVGSYNKQLFDQPIGHIIQYQAILTMKEKGRKMYYLGDRFYKKDLPFVTDKQVDISNFKQGFSSYIIPRVELIFQFETTNN